MTTIQFYHLTTTPLERALPKLLEKALASGLRALVAAESEERVEQLNQLLWTYDPGSFLPHGSAKDGNAERQPVLLSTGTAPQNAATVLIVTDGRMMQENFNRVLDLFDGRDQAAVQRARERWADYKNNGHSMAYLCQNENGGWEQKAVA